MATEKKKFFNTDKKGPKKPTYRHTWNRGGDEEEMPSESSKLNIQGQSASQQSARISPEKRKQVVTQERRIFKSKISRTIIAKTSSERFQDEEPCTQIRCSKTEKEYYTVVKNVKEASLCHDWGQAQEISADVEYLLSAVLDSENYRVKCLSVINIATKCESAQFRAQLRANGSSGKLFAALSDASKHPSLAICTACVIYLMARDRLGLMVDQRTLELILDLINLPDKDATMSDSICSNEDEEYENYRRRVWKILNDWRQQSEAAAAALNGGGCSQSLPSSQSSVSSENSETPSTTMMFDITMENLSARFLAIEALAFICCRTHDDNFRKWMREYRGLHYVSQYFTKEAEAILSMDVESEDYEVASLERVKMLDRYLRILEHTSFMNQQNQAYLVVWESSSLITTCAKLFKGFKAMCDEINPDDWEFNAAQRLPTKSIMAILTAVLKTLLNLSHSNALCCAKLGEHEGFIASCVDLVTCTIPEHVQQIDRFDLLVLSLGLLINLVEPCNANRRIAIVCVTPNGEKSLKALVKVFLSHEAAARETDDEVEREIQNSQEMHERNNKGEATTADIRQTVSSAIKKASKHMEDSIVASHIALFLGLLLQQNENAVDEIKAAMPDGKLEPLVAMLQKFLDFMRLTNAVGRTGEKTISKAIEAFERLG